MDKKCSFSLDDNDNICSSSKPVKLKSKIELHYLKFLKLNDNLISLFIQQTSITALIILFLQIKEIYRYPNISALLLLYFCYRKHLEFKSFFSPLKRSVPFVSDFFVT